MPQVLGLLRAWLYSICRFVQPRPDGCLSRIKRQSNTAYSIVQPWLDDRVSLICMYKLPGSWRRRQVGEHIRKCIKCLVYVINFSERSDFSDIMFTFAICQIFFIWVFCSTNISEFSDICKHWVMSMLHALPILLMTRRKPYKCSYSKIIVERNPLIWK